MTEPCPCTNWLDLLSARGLDVGALAAGEAAAVAEFDRHVAEFATAAAEEAERRGAWAHTQAAELAAIAAGTLSEAVAA